MAKTKKDIADQEEILKIYICLELPRKEIESIISKIKQHKRFKYYWEAKKSI